MDFWQKARSFAEEAAKRSQELTSGIDASKLTEVVSEASKRSREIAVEASKRSKEIAVEASKRSKEFAVEALKRADQIKVQLPPPASVISNLVESNSPSVAPVVSEAELLEFGVTDELRDFVKELLRLHFRIFLSKCMKRTKSSIAAEKGLNHHYLSSVDDSEVPDIPTVSNVRQDLSEWQEKHAKLVLQSVKEVSKLRYKLCPRVMKERKFWRIYFILVNSHVGPYEKKYNEEAQSKPSEKSQENVVTEVAPVGAAKGGINQKTKNAASTTSEQDLDVFLLGDTGDSDDGADDRNDDFDDDFDKI